MSTPIARPVGPTSFERMKQSLPEPEPKSKTVSAGRGGGGGGAATVKFGDDVGVNLLENLPDRRRKRVAGATGAGFQVAVGLEHAPVIIFYALQCLCFAFHLSPPPRTRKPNPADAGATGKVTIHAAVIPAMVFQCACPLPTPVPKSAPQDTWVVETASPNFDASSTRALVTRFAVNPWPAFIAVTRCAIVSATLREETRPPSAMATATATITRFDDSAWLASRIAAIFGVSFTGRAKQTAPALAK